jgi:hypothetical protein
MVTRIKAPLQVTRLEKRRGACSGNAAPPAGFTGTSEMSDVRQWRVKQARLSRLGTSNFDSTKNLEAENNNQVT